MAADKMREDQLQAVWFAAGTAAFMACIERAVVVSIFAHWRVWAFLALNLLLLAILFTSKPKLRSPCEEDDYGSVFNQKKSRREEFMPAVSVGGDAENVKSAASGGAVECERKNVKQEGGHDQITEEELNKRAEAFIAMFRQHLISDAKNFQARERLNSRSSFLQSKKVLYI